MRVTEEEFRQRLIRASRRRARQIADGSFRNEPWAPSVGLDMLFGEEPSSSDERRSYRVFKRMGDL
jgi:hypothetical protein